jgi:spermidine/putrescine transport system substrate-binding protein
VGVQRQFNIYKPIDYSRVNTDQLQPSMVKATQESTALNGQSFGVPSVWGTSGLIVHNSVADTVTDYTDLCDPAVAGKVSYRLKRPTLMGFAFAMGMDPFAAYNDRDEYQSIMAKVEDKLIDCKANVKTYWTGGDQLLSLLRTGEVTAAMAWDAYRLSFDDEAINNIKWYPPVPPGLEAMEGQVLDRVQAAN